MRKTLILTLVLCVFAVVAYAQTGTTAAATGTSTSAATGTGTTAATTGTKATKTKHAGAAKCTFKGSVASVDATAKSFVVHPAKGDDMTLKVNDKTKYSKGKGWDDVKADAKVWGTCHKDGADNWAVKVNFAAEKMMKEKPAAKTGK